MARHCGSEVEGALGVRPVTVRFRAIGIWRVFRTLDDSSRLPDAVLGLHPGASTGGHHDFNGPAGILTIAATSSIQT